MTKEVATCLFCQTKNEFDKNEREIGNCSQCGMPLSKNNPEGSYARRKRWLPFFWFVVIFCLVMIFYLPR